MQKQAKYFKYLCLHDGKCEHKRKDKKTGLPICFFRYYALKDKFDKQFFSNIRCNQQYSISINRLNKTKISIADLRFKRNLKRVINGD